MNNIDFSKQLIKGKIAEMIFEQMLREVGMFTVLAFGYENILPELMNRQHDMKTEQTMEIIRRAPDFAVINNQSHEVSLIEVKYRKSFTKENILKEAERMFVSWKPSYLFVATKDEFYFGKVKDIIENAGEIQALEHVYIPKELQEKYIQLLNKFMENV